jgi:hypothetical protein
MDVFSNLLTKGFKNMAGQVYAVPSAGGNFYGNQLSDVLRMNVQPLAKFRQFTDARMAVGKHRGQTFTWDISGDVAVPGNSLSETQTVPQTSIVVGQRHIDRYRIRSGYSIH